MIREAIVATLDDAGRPHLAPLGLIEEKGGWTIAPFRPSTTLDNLRAVPFATASFTDDARVFAGLVTGRRDWPLAPAAPGRPPRLEGALSHAELAVVAVEEHAQRPRFSCRLDALRAHRPFEGMNRARAAVLEGAVLITRLRLLPREKIEREMERLADAVARTAGPDESEAWSWLVAAREAFYSEK
ncbi:DUF447 domain-containing protein [Methylocella sp.]|uniref:DUF447 domain-containing protein n=1 Tax=Methylocella sp. TaxID=1978226 RepID=UPI0035B0C6FC